MASPMADIALTMGSRPIGFLDLPAEIRTIIYRLLFERHLRIAAVRLPQDSKSGITISLLKTKYKLKVWKDGRQNKTPARNSTTHRADAKTDTRPQVQFFRTCRVVHLEATAILYGTSDFAATDLSEAYFGLCYRFGKRNTEMIQALTITNWHDQRGHGLAERYLLEDFGRIVENFRGLKTFTVPRLAGNGMWSNNATVVDWSTTTLRRVRNIASKLPRLSKVLIGAVMVRPKNLGHFEAYVRFTTPEYEMNDSVCFSHAFSEENVLTRFSGIRLGLRRGVEENSCPYKRGTKEDNSRTPPLQGTRGRVRSWRG